jgi:hypothetical protein
VYTVHAAGSRQIVGKPTPTAYGQIKIFDDAGTNRQNPPHDSTLYAVIKFNDSQGEKAGHPAGFFVSVES